MLSILRSSLLLNSMLTNSSVWYGLTDKQIEHLQSVDEMLLRRVLSAPSKTPKPMLYLETGSVPIKFIIQSRRLMFLHYILNEDENSLVNTFFKVQNSNPLKGDWILTVKDDLKILKLNTYNFDNIRLMSKLKFKQLVDTAVKKESYAYLLNEKNKLSKIKHIQYSSLSMQNYLQPNEITTEEARFIFLLRSRMINVRINYPGSYDKNDLFCNFCHDKNQPDDQQHLLLCAGLSLMEVSNNNIKYDDLFCDDLIKQVTVSRILKQKYEKRSKH